MLASSFEWLFSSFLPIEFGESHRLVVIFRVLASICSVIDFPISPVPMLMTISPSTLCTLFTSDWWILSIFIGSCNRKRPLCLGTLLEQEAGETWFRRISSKNNLSLLRNKILGTHYIRLSLYYSFDLEPGITKKRHSTSPARWEEREGVASRQSRHGDGRHSLCLNRSFHSWCVYSVMFIAWDKRCSVSSNPLINCVLCQWAPYFFTQV